MPAKTAILFLIAANTLFLICFLAVLVFVLRRVLWERKGVSELAKAFQTTAEPEGEVYQRQTVGLGRMLRYRGCVSVSVSPQGLYLFIRTFRGRIPPVLIPWNQITGVSRARLYGRDAVSLSVGTPNMVAIRVYSGLFSGMRPYLEHLVKEAL